MASTGNWVVVSLLTLVAAMTFLSPETAKAAGRAVKKRAHVTVKPLVTLRNRPEAAVVTVRRGNVHRVASIIELQPARPSFGQLYGLHSTTDALDLKSGVALVLDQDTNEVLFSKNAQTVLPIASLTKLMTALVVTEANQPLDEVLTVSEDDVDTEKGSRSRLRVGTMLRREEMLHLALMSSREPGGPCARPTLSGRLECIRRRDEPQGHRAWHERHALRRADRPLESKPIKRARPGDLGQGRARASDHPRALDVSRVSGRDRQSRTPVPQHEQPRAKPVVGHRSAEDRATSAKRVAAW